jgi:hypothetical protein
VLDAPRAFDTGRLELLPHVEPRWRAEVAHAALHLGPDRVRAALGGNGAVAI